jgi:hypothetical protein
MVALVVANVYFFIFQSSESSAIKIVLPLLLILPYFYHIFKAKMLMELKSALIPGLMNTKEGVLEQWKRNSGLSMTLIRAQNILYLSFVAVVIFISILLITNQLDDFFKFFGMGH